MIIKYFVVSCIFYGEKRTLIFIYIYIDDNVLEGLNGKPTGEPISKKSEKTHGGFFLGQRNTIIARSLRANSKWRLMAFDFGTVFDDLF